MESTMILSLKQKLQQENSPQMILALITKPTFINNLSEPDLKELVKIVQSGTWKLHPKVMTTIYSIIVMKDCKSKMFNTKIAIESLTKYYRTLLQSESQNVAKKSRQVLAALLLRIPTFSNYKLIIKDLSPVLVPCSIMLDHNDQIKKQCPNLYQEFIFDKFKQDWVELFIKNKENYCLEKEFEIMQDICHSINQTGYTQEKGMEELYELEEKLKNQEQFLGKRIKLMRKQEVDLEKICHSLSSIFLFEHKIDEKNQLLLPINFKDKKNSLLKKSKQFSFNLLTLMIQKFRTATFRKINWIFTKLIKNVLLKNYHPSDADLCFVFSLVRKSLQVFGLGIYDFESLLFTQEYSIFKILQALCYNDYSNNQKQEKKQMNYQRNKNNKQKNIIQINIQQGALIETHYEDYLRMTDHRQRQNLLRECVHFCISFFTAKKECRIGEFSYASQILNVIQNSKNKINPSVMGLVSKLKGILFERYYGTQGNGFEGFCEKVFHDYLRKKATRSLERERAYQIIIEPSPSKKIKMNSEMLPQKKILSSSQNNEEIRKTDSFQVVLEGWGQNDGNKKEHRLESKSEMFYSIKECSDVEKESNKQMGEAGEDFILTPQF